MPPQQTYTQTVRSQHWQHALLNVGLHDPAPAGPLAAVTTQITCDICLTWSVDNPSSLPATVDLFAPNSWQSVEIATPGGNFLALASFALPTITINVPAGQSVGPTDLKLLGLVHQAQTVAGMIPELEGVPGTTQTIALQVAFPASLQIVQPGPCIVKIDAAISATVTLTYSP